MFTMSRVSLSFAHHFLGVIFITSYLGGVQGETRGRSVAHGNVSVRCFFYHGRTVDVVDAAVELIFPNKRILYAHYSRIEFALARAIYVKAASYSTKEM